MTSSFFDEPVIARFDEMAATRPDDVALVVGEYRYRYRELASRARRLARWLIERGVGPGRLVGLCRRRDVDMIVDVLAIMTCGAAYVPLDPGNPAVRQAQILEDADVDLVFTEPRFVPLFPEHGAQLVFDATLPLDEYADDPIPLRATAQDLAYVIFTSGSTGRPKGVMIDHHALAAFVAWTREAFDDDELGGVLCSSSIAFDVSVFELFAPLCHGGRVILVDNILALRDAPARDEVRLVSSVASGLAELTRLAPLPSGVRTVMQAGERLHAALARTLLAHQGLRLLNLCGATEDTVYSVWHHVTSADEDPPIGLPLTHHRAYVLDAELCPVAVGVPGELCYDGECVARGYLNRPDLTAKRFVSNPFGHSARMYRSGDLARWNARGELEFLHRVDDQVKIRGYRIELGEVEHHLFEHPRIAETVVVPHGEGQDKHLVAYFVASGAAPTDAELRAFLGMRLPDYMIPSRFVPLETFPHNASGKIDRGALPDPFTASPRTVRQLCTQAESPLELRVRALFQEVLDVADVGLDDDFFALGGHSLLAARLVARLEEIDPVRTARFREGGTGTLLAIFFREPTVRGLAANLEARGGDGAIVTLIRAGDPARTPMFWFHGMVTGDGLYVWHLLGQLPPDVPFYVVHPHGYDSRPFPADIARLAEDCLQRLLAVRPHGPYIIGGFCNGALIAYDVATRLRAAGERVDGLVLAALPPLVALAERLRPLADRLCDVLRLGESARKRLMRWSRVAATMLWMLSRGSEEERRELFARLRTRVKRLVAPRRLPEHAGENRWADPSFRLAHYESAIAEYRISPYDGSALILVGKDDVPSYAGPDGGWSRYIAAPRFLVVPGGHCFVVDSARHVGTILASVADGIHLELTPRTGEDSPATRPL